MSLGLGLSVWHGARRGAGSSGYHADAVHFSTDDQIERGSALSGVVDGRSGLFGVWRKSSDRQRNWWTSIGTNSVSIDEKTDTGNLEVFLASEDGNSFVSKIYNNPALSDGDWHNLLVSWNTNFAAGLKVVQVFKDRVQLTPDASLDDQAAFDVFYEDASGWGFINSQGDNIACDAADMVFYTDQFIDLTVEANLRKFITAGGKPSDPSGFPVGYAVLFTGDSAAFSTNQGSGGAFTLAGSLTDASSSPSD